MFKNTKLKCILLYLTLILLTSGCRNADSDSLVNTQDKVTPLNPSGSVSNNPNSISASGNMTVHFLDVGQGLSVFVQSEGQNLIYDGGDRTASRIVVAYLKELGVTDIDYLISSHYDSDHLAGLIGCLNAFTVHNVIGSDYEHDSRLYSSFMNAVAAKRLEIRHPKVGTHFPFGSGQFSILSPAEITGSSNANSVVIKLQNGNNSFLLTGDADHHAEALMCRSGLNLACDVLSVSHHGSATGTSYDFLEQALPETAVISCGANNQYGHPDKDTLDKLQDMQIKLYRTDQQGVITAFSDGQKITWNQEPGNDYAPGDPADTGTRPQQQPDALPEPAVPPATAASGAELPAGDTVWKSASGKKYHQLPDCGRMNPNHAVQLSPQEAAAQGLKPCRKCFS